MTEREEKVLSLYKSCLIHTNAPGYRALDVTPYVEGRDSSEALADNEYYIYTDRMVLPGDELDNIIKVFAILAIQTDILDHGKLVLLVTVK